MGFDISDPLAQGPGYYQRLLLNSTIRGIYYKNSKDLMPVAILEVIEWEDGEPDLFWRIARVPNYPRITTPMKPSRATIPIYDALFCRSMLLDILAPMEVLFVVFERHYHEFLTVDEVTEHKLAFERLVWRRLVKEGIFCEPRRWYLGG